MNKTFVFLGMATVAISSADAQTVASPPGALWRQGSTLLRHPGFVRALAFSPDGKLLASGGSDGAVRLWDPTDGRLLHVFFGNAYENRLYAVAFSPDGQTLAAGTGSGIYLWDVASQTSATPPAPTG